MIMYIFAFFVKEDNDVIIIININFALRGKIKLYFQRNVNKKKNYSPSYGKVFQRTMFKNIDGINRPIRPERNLIFRSEKFTQARRIWYLNFEFCRRAPLVHSNKMHLLRTSVRDLFPR